jgi:SET domain-containing protein
MKAATEHNPVDTRKSSPAINPDDVIIKNVDGKGRGVFANQNFKQGDLVIVGKPLEIIKTRTMTSLQVAWDDHAELDEPARVTNHSCDPNTGIKNNEHGGYSFHALRGIAAGTEITWDYNTTEYLSIAVPSCCCGSDNCRGQTLGFKFLEEELRSRFGDYIGAYLKTPENA